MHPERTVAPPHGHRLAAVATPPAKPRSKRARASTERIVIPADVDNALMTIDGRAVRLTNLRKLFWPEHEITKAQLLQYYADVAWALLPHLVDRAMVMKR